MRKILKKISLLILCILVVTAAAPCAWISTVNASDTKRVVRIAFFPMQGYNDIDENGNVTGMDADYQLKVIVPDMDHYQKFLLEKLTRVEGVTSVRSSFVLNHVQLSTALPLAHFQHQ